jgi:hypothetical protein
MSLRIMYLRCAFVMCYPTPLVGGVGVDCGRTWWWELGEAGLVILTPASLTPIR